MEGEKVPGVAGPERRHLQRFSVRAYATVQTLPPGSERTFELNTQDISSGGAFFPTEVPLPTGEKVKITLYLAISPLASLPDLPGGTKIVTEGEVVRSGAQGMAVAFATRYTISPMAV